MVSMGILRLRSQKEALENIRFSTFICLDPLRINKDAACRLCLSTDTSLIAIDFLYFPNLFLTVIVNGEIDICFAFVKFLIVFFAENLFIKKP